MAVNLITSAWLPIERASGARDWISPLEISGTDDPVVRLTFPRADWTAAVSEFLIGLVGVAFTPADDRAWGELWKSPPSPAALAEALQPFAFAFELAGDGPRAFQDHAPLDHAEDKPVAALLIDSPGENTLKKNTDLFVKRGGAGALCLPYAAAALITLQTYAPTGGAGHRTSIRGGGPLSVLVAPRLAGGEPLSLWRRLWANVPEVAWDALPDSSPAAEPEWATVFPWLGATRTSAAQSPSVTPDLASPLLAFFACPRRIRLQFAPRVDDSCGFDGPPGDQLVFGFKTQNYGANYLGWRHPLSPYREDKVSGKLPIHPRSGPASWRDWLGWWGFDAANEACHPPQVVELWRRRAGRLGLDPWAAEIAAFGYDMDNAKARQWVDQRIPWIDVENTALQSNVRMLIAGAQEAASTLRFQVKLARHGQRQSDGRYRLPDQLPKGASSEVSDALWARTEPYFRRSLRNIIADADAGRRTRSDFLPLLRRTAVAIFDDNVDFDGLLEVDGRRFAKARAGLDAAFSPWGKVAQSLQVAAARPTRKEAA